MVDPLTCLAHRGVSACTACFDRCPVDGAMSRAGSGFRVDPRVCTGCGVCRDVCPAPTNAVRFLPGLASIARTPPKKEDRHAAP